MLRRDISYSDQSQDPTNSEDSEDPKKGRRDGKVWHEVLHDYPDN